jgi:signal transduction histidine kinase
MIDTNLNLHREWIVSEGIFIMKAIVGLSRSIRELPAKYPAVISGYIIYLYLFFVMIRFFIVARNSEVNFFNVLEMFDALPFMWFLAITLVKVIHFRTILHESETQRIMKEKELQIKETQIGTMREVVLGLQHQINNPLAVIILTIHKVRRSVPLSQEMIAHINSIEKESKRISQAVKDLSDTQNYVVEQIGKTLGTMAVPAKHE